MAYITDDIRTLSASILHRQGSFRLARIQQTMPLAFPSMISCGLPMCISSNGTATLGDLQCDDNFAGGHRGRPIVTLASTTARDRSARGAAICCTCAQGNFFAVRFGRIEPPYWNTPQCLMIPPNSPSCATACSTLSAGGPMLEWPLNSTVIVDSPRCESCRSSRRPVPGMTATKTP